MNGRHSRGCGMESHERTYTTRKKAANSIVGKLTLEHHSPATRGALPFRRRLVRRGIGRRAAGVRGEIQERVAEQPECRLLVLIERRVAEQLLVQLLDGQSRIGPASTRSL